MARLNSPARSAGLAAVFFAALLSSCATSGRAPARPVSGLGTLLVVPFTDMSALSGPGVTVRSPISGSVFTTGGVAEGGAEALTRTLTASVSALGYTLASYEDAIGARSLALDAKKGLSDKDLALETARKMGVDGVVTGFVYRYEERVGTTYAAEKPASAAFDVFLLRASDGAVIWSARFDEAQKPLSDNLLDVSAFVKRHASWITVEEFAREGLTAKLAGFPVPGASKPQEK